MISFVEATSVNIFWILEVDNTILSQLSFHLHLSCFKLLSSVYLTGVEQI